MSSLKILLEKHVKVITVDGRLLLGTLEGFDNTTNIVLSGTRERIFSLDDQTEEIPLGGCIVRGNEVVCIADYDEDQEASIDYTAIHAAKLKDTKNSLL